MSEAVPLDYARNFVKVPRPAIATLCGDLLTLAVFMVCVSRARWNAAVVRTKLGAIHLRCGQAVVGREELARVCRTTVSKVRTALNRLQNLGYLTIETTRPGTIVTVVGYGEFGEDAPAESPVESPPNDQPIARRLAAKSPTESPLTKKGTSREAEKPIREKGENRGECEGGKPDARAAVGFPHPAPSSKQQAPETATEVRAFFGRGFRATI